MARSVDEINAYIKAQLVTNFAAIGITIDPATWSKRNMLRAICFTVATCQALLEQLQDLFQQTIEDIAAKAPAASAPWVQDKMFKFQYSATDPQIIALVDTVPIYPVVDPLLRIITACSVTSSVANETSVKVAKGNPFVALSAPEKSAAQGYINIIGVAGINYVVVSLESDKMYIDADIYYQGQYASVIQANVIAAIEAWFVDRATNNFNGAVEMADLEQVINSVNGVNDVVLNNVRGRADADLFSSGIDFILGTQVIQRKWSTVAGYIGQEDTATKTFADTLNFIAE